MNETPTPRRPYGIVFVVIFFVVVAIYGAVSWVVPLNAMRSAISDPGDMHMFDQAFFILSLGRFGEGVLLLLAAWGIWRKRRWARILSILLLFLALIWLPINFLQTSMLQPSFLKMASWRLGAIFYGGPILSLVALYYLFLDKATVEAFRKPPKNQESK